MLTVQGGEAEELLNRDYTAATESAVDMSMLPKVMQAKNFGKVSRWAKFGIKLISGITYEIYPSYRSRYFLWRMG